MNKCVGCGVELQNVNEYADGYVEDLSYVLCSRCFTIKYYGQNKAPKKSNIDYDKILSKIRNKDVVVYVSSLLTLNLGSCKAWTNPVLKLYKKNVIFFVSTL